MSAVEQMCAEFQGVMSEYHEGTMRFVGITKSSGPDGVVGYHVHFAPGHYKAPLTHTFEAKTEEQQLAVEQQMGLG